MASLPLMLTSALVGVLLVQVACVSGLTIETAPQAPAPTSPAQLFQHNEFSDALEESFDRGSFNQEDYDASGFQLEGCESREFEGNKTFDDQYNDQFIEQLRDVVEMVPGVHQIRMMLKEKFIDFGNEDEFDYSRLSCFAKNPWWTSLLSANSCPRTQNYGCRSVYWRMPCFRHGHGHCCPIYPQSIVNRIAHCNCCKCAVLSQNGAQCGDCTRRYKWQQILTVCFHQNQQPYLQWMWKPIPTSCYCKT